MELPYDSNLDYIAVMCTSYVLFLNEVTFCVYVIFAFRSVILQLNMLNLVW